MRTAALAAISAFLAANLPAGTGAGAAALSRAPERNDYRNAPFCDALEAGLRSFYSRRFAVAQHRFADAAAIVPDNTLAISFMDASAANVPGAIDGLVADEERAVSDAPSSYVHRVRLGFAYLFASLAGRNRDGDARDALDAATKIAPHAAAAHVGLGIMRYNERSAHPAKAEFLAALDADSNDVLAREYLGELYQIDLHDPQRGLAYLIDVANVVPGYADINFHIGSLLYDLKSPDAAVAYVTRGLELDIGHVGEAGRHGYTLLARIYLGEQKLDDARRVLQAAIEAGTDAAYARSMLAKIAHGDYDRRAKPAGLRP